MNDTGSNFSPASSNFFSSARRRSVEFVRRGALKRKDRLLLVADREDGAHHAVARAFAGGEFGNDVDDNVPLPRAGILRLVDQHVVDAAVELVVHPAGRDAVQHRQRLVDQVVIVEQAALLLLAPVVRRRRGRDVQQRLRCGRGSSRARRRSIRRPMRTPSASNSARDRRIAVAELLGQHRFARRCARRSGTRRDIRRPARLPVNGSASRSRSAWSLFGLVAGHRAPRRCPPSAIAAGSGRRRSRARRPRCASSGSTPSAADNCAAAASTLPASSVQAMK